MSKAMRNTAQIPIPPDEGCYNKGGHFPEHDLNCLGETFTTSSCKNKTKKRPKQNTGLLKNFTNDHLQCTLIDC